MNPAFWWGVASGASGVIALFVVGVWLFALWLDAPENP